jgi:GNAT superfamily N-acetyltransferase
VEIVPFSDDYLDGAAALLAARHARHRSVEPLLPAVADFRVEVEREWRADAAGGVAALDGGDLAGYLIGHRRTDAVGPHLWSHVAGHAVRTPELLPDLYAAAAGPWVESGLTRHFVFAPALDALVEPWFRLSFGGSGVLALRETAREEPLQVDVAIREGTPEDVEAAVRLDRAMAESMLPAPSFSGHEPMSDEDAIEEWRETWSEPGTYRHFVAERRGRVVGHIVLYRRPADLRVPADAIDLAAASTEPAARGSGVGTALTAHALTWAHEHGHPTMTIDWRLTNLRAARFWPRHGFRETFLRLYRSIP